MRRVLSALAVFLLPATALADGKFYSTPVALAANVTIPDQRALIHFTNGVERLVIETRFTGSGTNFAWVVPLPSQPVVEEASAGVFPTLEYLFRPEIRHSVAQYYPGMFGLAWLGYLLLFVRPTGRLAWLDIAMGLLVSISVGTIESANGPERGFWLVTGTLVFLDLVFVVALVRLWNHLPFGLGAAMLTSFIALQVLPFAIVGSLEPLEDGKLVWALLACLDVVFIVALFKFWKDSARVIGATVLASLLLLQMIPLALTSGVTSRSMGAGSAPSPAQNVSILDRRLVGVFETTTITSRVPKALQSWLRDNGFVVTTNTEPVIDSYAKDGWVFVAVKVRRDRTEQETSTPHPLSFTFKTDKPVYPMRLTGVDNGPLQVELYVFGPSRAKAANFKTARCAHAEYPQVPSKDSYSWSYRLPSRPTIVHPLLRQWLEGAPVATKLSATLLPAQMNKDVWLEWTSFAERGNRVFSNKGALTIGTNWGAGVFAGLLLLATFGRLRSLRSSIPSYKLLGFATLLGVATAGGTWLALPKTEIKMMKRGDFMNKPQSITYHLSWDLKDASGQSPTLNLSGGRAEVERMIKIAYTNAPYWNQWAKESDWNNWQNYYLGGPLREEDSPGNYSLREENGWIQFIGYDALGAEHVFHQWPVQKK